MHDEEIADIRKIRREISAECGHDVRKVAAYYRAAGEQLRRSRKFRVEEAPSKAVPPGDAAKTS